METAVRGSKHPLYDEVARRATECGLLVECAMDGSTACEIAVVAEAPGPREVQLGVPLIGGAGKLLWNTLRPHGIFRRDCYVTNVCKRQIAFEKNKRRPLSSAESEYWQRILKWELAQLPNLRFILISGGLALEALTGLTGVSARRGSVVSVPLDNGKTVQGVITLNPAAVLRELKQEVAFKLDCAKLDRVIRGLYRHVPVTTHINPGFKEAREWVARLRRSRNPVAFDIETITNETACVGFADNGTEGFCINFRDRRDNRFTTEEEMVLRRDIQGLLLDPNVRLVAQNASFDSYWLWYKDHIKVKPVWFDTMLAHHALYPLLPHNLGFLCTQYTDHPYYKDEGKQWREGGDIDTFWSYNVRDCCITWQVHAAIHRELRAQEMEQFFFEHVMPIQPHLVRMTVGGVKVDMTMRSRIERELTDEVQRKLQAFYDAVHAATGDTTYFPSPRSPKQLSELLFDRLGLIGRGASTDDDNREEMFNHPRTTEAQRAVIRTLNEYTTDHKFLSTYVQTPIDPDDRIRCEYKQTGTQKAPGRLSSSKTLWGSGGNLQNIPPRGRAFFVADPDYRLVYFDLSQAEARLVAWFANIPVWKEQFERARKDGGYDCHRALASEMWHLPYDEVPKEDFLPDETGQLKPTKRFLAKRCRHGLNYRMGPDRLAQTTGLSRPEAYNIYTIYHSVTPELRKWWAELEMEIRNKRMLFNAFGRRLVLLERMGDEAMESIVAFKPQSTIGDKVCRVIRQCETDVRWPRRARIALNIHDALIALAHKDDWKRVAQIMRLYAEEPIVVNGEPVIIPAEIGLSQPDGDSRLERWSTIKKIKNEDLR